MKIKIAIMHLHRHGNGGGGPGKLYPLIKNEHRPYNPHNTYIDNAYFRYPLMGFRQVWSPATE